MNARSKLFASGFVLLVVAVVIVLALVAEFWPFQPVVEVVIPFVIVAVLVAVGLSSILAAHFLPVEMFEAPLAQPPRWADWLSVAALGVAVLGLLIAATLPGPLNPAMSSPPFVSGYAVVTGCSLSPAATSFEIHYSNSGAGAAMDVVAQYIMYSLNASVRTYGSSVPVGQVAGRQSGAIAVTAPVGCGPYGTNVDVTFTWS